MTAFGYVSLTIIVALTIPLAISLDRRARAELERENLIRAGTIAQDVGAENLAPDRVRTLRELVDQAAPQVDGRVIVVDASGRLIADSQGATNGELYATPERPEIVAALQDRPTSVVRFSRDLGVDIMATAVPIVDESPTGTNAVVGAVRITRSMDQVDATVHRVTLGVVAIGAAGLAAGLILAFALSGSLARPLRRLADAAKRFGSGDLSVRAGDIKGPDEVEQLATSFDRMAEQVEGTVRAQRAFVGNASHQLRTPLAGMKLRLESVIADADDDALRAELVAAETEVDRLSAIVDRLLATAARSEVAPPDVVDLHAIAEDAVGRWQAQAREAATRLTVDGSRADARVHRGSIEQIIDNLLDNALVYAPGDVRVATTARDGQAIIEVRDHGPGIAPDELDHVAERFYRGSGMRAGGSGLGLAIVQELAEGDGGSMGVSRAPDRGTIVEVSFPAASG